MRHIVTHERTTLELCHLREAPSIITSMVLHLLGKKSWNVYNSANVERVRRDEAEAKAREEAEEQQMQDEDAARRLAILRGKVPPDLPEPAEELVKCSLADTKAVGLEAGRSRRADADALPRERKRRRLRGEDDTDRDIRYAREDAQTTEKAKQALLKLHGDDAPLVDDAGHLMLIPAAPDEKGVSKADKNAQAKYKRTKNHRCEEDQRPMRFSNAAGYNSGGAKPWYAQTSKESNNEKAGSEVVLPYLQDKGVWGNEDLLRKERERTRILSSDPFAAMQQAQRQLKLSRKDKVTWEQQRLAEVGRQNSDKRRRREEKRSRRGEDENGLEDFSLDEPADMRRRGDRSDRRHHSHRHHDKPNCSRRGGHDHRERSVKEGSIRDTG